MRHIWIYVFGCLLSPICAELFEECRNVTQLTFVASPKSCRKYIFCDGEDSYEGECDNDDYFNALYQTCDPKELVECYIQDNIADETDIAMPTNNLPITTELITELISSTTAATALSTSTALTTTTTTDIVNPTTITKPPTTTTAIAAIKTTIKPITTITSLLHTHLLVTACPAIDDPQRLLYMLNPFSCSDYAICHKGMAIRLHCARMLHFNAQTAKCDYPQLAKCQLNPLASPKEQCQPHTNDYFPHASHCNYFYYCKNGYLLLQHCPFAYGWDFERRACVSRNYAKCYTKNLTV